MSEDRPRKTARRRLPRTAMPYVVLVVALILTGLGTAFVSMSLASRDRLRFQAAVRRAQQRVMLRMDTYTAMLRATNGLFASRFPIAPDEFFRYAEQLDLRRNYPGVFGIGFAVRYPMDGKAGFEAFMVNAAKYEGFKVWPTSKLDEGASIVYLEPRDERNARAIGYDMLTEPTRRAAMQRSRDEGVAVASGRVTLVQDRDEPGPQAGFLIYLPVYQSGTVPPTIEERRKTLRGWVYSPFRAGDLFEEALVEETRGGLAVQAYDGDVPDPGHLLYHSGQGGDAAGGLESTNALTIAGRTWTIVSRATPTFLAGPARLLPVGTALAGLGLSAGLFYLLRAQTEARMRAERITEELRASRKDLLAAKESAENANRLKDEFLATVSHELRTPLNAILGWAQLLDAGTTDPDDVRQGVETILRNSRMQAQLIEDLLDISRIVTGKLRLDARPVDVGHVIQAAVASVQLAADAKGVRVTQELTPVASGQLYGDPSRLQQVVWNLLSNSIKFTPAGGQITVRTRVRTEDSGPRAESTDKETQRSVLNPQHLVIEVQDTGVGIAEAFLPYTFDRFRQADGSITRKHGGLGLGLSIVKNLVELHGGTVRAESPGANLGATFVIALPLRGGAARGEGRVRRGVPRPASRTTLASVRVLVVDDDPDARDLVAMILSGHEAEVTTTGSAAKALEVLRGEQVDVLVSDLAMPEEDGFDLIRMVRELPPQYGGKVPALAVSALTRAVDRERSIEAGYQMYLPKPVDPKALIAAVFDLYQSSGAIGSTR